MLHVDLSHVIRSQERTERLGSEHPSPSLVQAGAAVLAETLRGRVLSLAANGLDELADVVEARESAAVDSLVHLSLIHI